MQIGTIARRTETGEFLPSKPLTAEVKDFSKDTVFERFLIGLIAEKTGNKDKEEKNEK